MQRVSSSAAAAGSLVGGAVISRYGADATVLVALIVTAIALPATWASNFLAVPGAEPGAAGRRVELDDQSDRQAARQYFLQHVNQNTVFFHNLREKLDYLVSEGYYEQEVLDQYSFNFVRDLFDEAYAKKFRFPTFLGAFKYYTSYTLKTFDGKRYLDAMSNYGVAALGHAETAQVRDLVAQLKDEGIAIFLISHDIHDVFDLADRITVMLQGKLVGTVAKDDVTKDEVLGMIIMGKVPGALTRQDVEQLH